MRLTQVQLAKKRSSLALAVCLTIGICCGGCGGPLGPQIVKVSGTLTYNGDAVEDASITLLPADKNGGQPATGVTNREGQFVISRPGAEKPGIEPGDYKIRIEAYKIPLHEIPPSQLNEREESNRVIPKKYFSEQTSGLTVTISPTDREKDLPLELKD